MTLGETLNTLYPPNIGIDKTKQHTVAVTVVLQYSISTGVTLMLQVQKVTVGPMKVEFEF